MNYLSGKVLLIGGYGAGNVGDEAILSGLINKLPSDISTLYVTSHSPAKTKSLHQDDIDHKVDFRPIEPRASSIGKITLTVDNVVIGGGGIFSDYMGPFARAIPLYAAVNKLAGRGLHWTSIGVYPSTPSYQLSLVSQVMKRSDSVTVRDYISRETLKSNGVSSVKKVQDPGFMISPDTASAEQKVNNELNLRLNDELIGIAPRRVKHPKNNAALKKTYYDLCSSLLSEGKKVILIPFCNHPYEEIENDYRLAKEIEDKFSGVHTLYSPSPQITAGLVECCSAFLTTRLHSLIFSEVVGTPFVSINYAEKCNSILSEIEKESHGVELDQAKFPVVAKKFRELGVLK